MAADDGAAPGVAGATSSICACTGRVVALTVAAGAAGLTGATAGMAAGAMTEARSNAAEVYGEAEKEALRVVNHHVCVRVCVGASRA